MYRRDDYQYAVGLDHDVNNLEEMLFHKDHPELMFISIVGESGVGKSTLAYVIRDNMKGRFDVSLYYIVYNNFNTESLLQEVYQIVQEEIWEGRGISRTEEGTDIGVKLHNLLASKTFLLIIKGISSKTKLNCLKASLPDDNNGSRVVLIQDTENEEVAWHANSMNKESMNAIHMLSRLDTERSWQLFCLRVLRKDVSDEKEKMRKYDKVVYDITGGYPLAIVILAGLLRFKERPGQWEAVLRHLRAGTSTGLEQGHEGPATSQAGLSTTSTIERVFWASFEDLPNELKSCLLYFVTYPKNTHPTADGLVKKWMAEGFLRPHKGKTMEELGHDYLKELVLRCLVQVEGMHECGAIEYVGIHQNLVDLLQSEAHEAGFFEVHDIYNSFVPPSEQHISDSTWYNLKFLCGSKFLRVMDVRGVRIKKLPKEIGDLIHLRYLCVHCPTLGYLPSSIKRLFNLQTLDIRTTRVDKIHPCFWKIKTLRHVVAEELTLPNVLAEELDELQTLFGVKPAEEGEWEQSSPLLKMTKLRLLKLTGLVHTKHGAALESALRKMSSLRQLGLQSDQIPSCVFTAPSLRYLELVNLQGNVQWPEAALNLAVVRPNLVRVALQDSGELPQRISDELKRYY
ncbi:putative disease resistance RPP13-like protein 3 [Lolium rigidum]|uniref:putative disease resistance RPP13-like protein 3 n=1 Tax=Lolium rigidum TaxID=89674 RepID=UPI001F5D65FE|nr:putative disease resistance RPP13-like protein 3 [Lolium rigidum]